ncbi:MAG: carboxyl transferase domain-containing protein [Porticoccaceae bacterium]|jgi:geranyl-CoA carboxylase beta subunit|nr:acyl-CoA carboxylase subunit beta [Porticoccaceae bacterium]MBT6319740.1 acyl-CoA carboxylase subunit beta [Porticoccaceae bacterium]MBT7258342.1 acyl-CoA carboxylase subunit beta [Porticoccaceae bacterium]MBT7905469.1 acyl-CoA carboxylase subunit beta [Porticoccaceae bacterium]MDG1446516.1 carboxyl transferase domain-containing protein [Porticoccaceae bacterium]
MAVFASKINTSSETYLRQRAEMLELVDKLNELNSRGRAISEKRKPRFDKRGQLTPRERLARLLDPGMPFLEIGNLAGYKLDTKDEAKSIPGGTVISGIGFISGVRCCVVVDDSGILAGSLTLAGGYRIARAQQISLEQRLPFVHLVESAGGDLMNYTVENFAEGGDLFGALAKLSKEGIPVISILHGSSTAGGAYMPGLSDYVIAVKGTGRAFLAGPPLLKAATGEIATEEELGGSEMHATTSGLAEYLAENDGHGIQICREVVARLQWNDSCQLPEAREFAEPIYDPDELAGVIPVDYRTPYDMRELVARVVDGSDFLDFKPRFGVSTVCIQAEIYGQAVGIIGNNGPIDPQGANKATQFLQLLDQADIPALFFQNTTGYIVGTKSEQAGMIKHGSKMIQAVRNIDVPRITFMTGASFGAGNYGMCGRGYDPDFLYTFPNAKMGVMGGEQAAKTMSMVARGKAAAMGVEPDEEALAAQEKGLAHIFDSQSDAFYTSGHLLDDGMIDPRNMRKTLGLLLETVREARHRTVRPNSFGIARL